MKKLPISFADMTQFSLVLNHKPVAIPIRSGSIAATVEEDKVHEHVHAEGALRMFRSKIIHTF